MPDEDADSILEAIVDEICQEIAENFVSEGMETMWGMVGNAGQESLISDIEGDYMDQVDSVADGEFDPVESDHPEAVGIITDVGNAYLAAGAAICELIRQITDIADLFF